MDDFSLAWLEFHPCALIAWGDGVPPQLKVFGGQEDGPELRIMLKFTRAWTLIGHLDAKAIDDDSLNVLSHAVATASPLTKPRGERLKRQSYAPCLTCGPQYIAIGATGSG